ncbi:hypothetical protein V6N12_009550 [Hibiscus sabdariffa]|uniref:Uncharacterized protein n=1 Tax=Hibiscus sabdariffa TaxID=183260 RepID=A0ABR2AUG9_9ROSI
MFAGAGGALGYPPLDSPTLYSSEQVYISSLFLLKMLKHGDFRSLFSRSAYLKLFFHFLSRLGHPYLNGPVLVLKQLIMFFKLISLICSNKQEGQRWWWAGTIHIRDLAVGFLE